MDDEFPVLERLNALMKSGYRISARESQSLESSLILRHPATKRVKHSEITLYNDGAVVGNLSHIDGELNITFEENTKFAKFIRSVPAPTLWERSEDMRVSITVWFLLGAIFIGPAIWGLYKKYV